LGADSFDDDDDDDDAAAASAALDPLETLLARASSDPTATQLRLDRFIHTALTSPVQTPSDQISTTELAFCLEALGVNVTDIKKKVLKHAPLVTLSWVYTTLYRDQPDAGDGRPSIPLLQTYSDAATRKEMGTWLFLEHVLFAAEHTAVDTTVYRKTMWDRFIAKVSKDDDGTELILLPEGTVSMGIQKSIVQARCGVGMKFREGRLGDMISDASDVRNKQVFNLPRENLCTIVGDLNLLSSADTRKAISKCVNALNDHPPSTLDLSDKEYSVMKLQADSFLRLVDDWENAIDGTPEGGWSFCGESQDCRTRIQRLQVLAGHIRQQATTCGKQISAFRQRSRKRDPQNKRTFVDQIRSWF
jgi:hypothetical protein